MFRKLVASFALAALSLAPMFGCAPDNSIDSSEEVDERDSALSVGFEEIAVTKSNAPPGVTVIKKKADYVAFFGVQPPPGLSFNSSWVLHYSMGVENTGGYSTSVDNVERIGKGSTAHLLLTTQDVSPGSNCPVTQSLTNPQVTIKIPKQKSGVTVNHIANTQVTDCSADDEYCFKVKCANGYVCDEAADACVPRPCDQDDPNTCPSGFACENHLACFAAPCPSDFRCWPVTAPPPPPANICDEIGWIGTCDAAVLSYCTSDDVVHTYDCSPGSCGWVPSYGFYDCQ